GRRVSRGRRIRLGPLAGQRRLLGRGLRRPARGEDRQRRDGSNERALDHSSLLERPAPAYLRASRQFGQLPSPSVPRPQITARRTAAGESPRVTPANVARAPTSGAAAGACDRAEPPPATGCFHPASGLGLLVAGGEGGEEVVLLDVLVDGEGEAVA